MPTVLVAHPSADVYGSDLQLLESLAGLTEHGQRHYERVQARVLDQIVPLLARLDACEIAAVQVALPALRRAIAGDEEVVR